MNQYEYKFKTNVGGLIVELTNISKSILDVTCDNEKLSEQVDALKVSINTVDDVTAKACLEKGIADTELKIKDNEDEINRLRKVKTQLESKLKIFRLICPHEYTEYDYDDYHRNITYDKCKLCGKGKL